MVAWRDPSGRVRKLLQGGAVFIPWPIQQQQQEEEIPRDAIVMNANSELAAWRRLVEFCVNRQGDVEKNAEGQRTQPDKLGKGHEKFLLRKRKAGGEQEQGLQYSKGHPEIFSNKRRLTDEQEQGSQNHRGQDERERDVAEQGLQNLILSLPRDLIVHKVLPCLPLPKIFELRCVSREWKSLLSSTHLMQQCIATQQGHEEWLVMAGRAPGLNECAKEFIAYVPSLGRWISFLLPRSPPISTLLGCDAELLQERVKLDQQRNPNNILMTSAGGLICCFVYSVPPESYDWTTDVPNYTVLVFNPLTGHMKKLPPISFSNVNLVFSSLHMLYDQANNSYKIILSYRVQTTHVYDSKTGSWKTTWPQLHLSSSMGILNADLLFYERNKNDVYTLYGYHMESDTWSSLVVPEPPLFGHRNGDFFLKKLNGRVLLAYDFRPSAAPAELQGFTVWELNYSSGSLSPAAWVEMAWTPSKFWNQFHDMYLIGDLANDTSFISSGRLLCMTVADFEDEDYGGSYSTPLVYDLDLKSWYRLPPYKGSRRFMGLFSFHPTLNVPM